jgi:hypothetical protein
MATPNIETYNKYYGNGETTEFSVSFPYSKREYVKVYVRRVGFEQVSVDPKDYEFVNDKTIRYPSNTSSDDILRDGDIITIQRETTVASEFIFSNQKRLFPEDVMDADDLAFQILQEQKREFGRAIVVDPTSEVQPKVLLEKVDLVYNRIDDIETVSQNIGAVDNVAKNIDGVNDAAKNIDAILDAPNQAESARQSAQTAEQQADRAENYASIQTYRNIGDIFFTARIDSELNGAVECNGATYNKNDFTGEQAIGNLLGLGKVPYISLAEYQTAIDTNGSCRAFGWDGGDSFRVPTIPALLLTKEQAGVVGNGKALGLKSAQSEGYLAHSGGVWLSMGKGNDVGNEIGSNWGGDGQWLESTLGGINTDPTKSGIVANLDTVQYRAMVQLANEATDEAFITATSALQQIANKANTDASNFTADGKETVVGWGMPSDEYIDLTMPASGQEYTAPANGFYNIKAQDCAVTLENTTKDSIFVEAQSSFHAGVILPVQKGDVVKAYITTLRNLEQFRFIYAEGEV